VSHRYRVLVVDDEGPARAKIARLLAADSRFELVGEARDGLGALKQIEALQPDVVLLDVQIPGINGFEVLDALGPDRGFAVVFSTAHDRHALQAFDAHAVDYLLKPYDQERFARALDKAHAQLAGGRRDPLGPMAAGSDRMVIKTTEGWVALPHESIVRISAAGKYVSIVTSDGSHLVRQTLTSIAERLDAERFVRVHRSEIVRVGAVAKLEPWTHGDAILTLRDGSTLVLSRTCRRQFLARWS
jgi:two-component system, LytTR family, response regulator